MCLHELLDATPSVIVQCDSDNRCGTCRGGKGTISKKLIKDGTFWLGRLHDHCS